MIRVCYFALAVTACARAPAATGDGNTDAVTTSGSGVANSTGRTFVVVPDAGQDPVCSLYRDDCPPGYKCSPYASDPKGLWDATRCIAEAPNPAQSGQSCVIVDRVASGIDDCERGAFCVAQDNVALTGTCMPFCRDVGDIELQCDDPDAQCLGSPDGPLRLCSVGCDPLTNSCPRGQGCYRVANSLVCLVDASGPEGAYGDPCLFTNACDPGSLCADLDEFAGCPHEFGCCTALCDSRDPEASANCPGSPEHRCMALFMEGKGPPLYWWVGACVVPTPDGP